MTTDMTTDTTTIANATQVGEITTDYWKAVKNAFLWTVENNREAIVEEGRRAGLLESDEEDVGGLLLALEGYDAQLGVVFFLRENPDVRLSEVRDFERAAGVKIERDLPLDEAEANAALRIARGVFKIF